MIKYLLIITCNLTLSHAIGFVLVQEKGEGGGFYLFVIEMYYIYFNVGYV